MSASLVKEAQYKEITKTTISFDYIDGNGGGGFCFNCDDQGNPILATPASKATYEACLTGEFRGCAMSEGYRQSETRNVKVSNAIRACVCGKHIEFYGHGCDEECPRCHRVYNSAGQLLAHRSQWGAETNERPSDVAKAFSRR